MDGLRKGCDILYLVCHGAMVDGRLRLFLENDAGQVVPAAGSELAVRLKELGKLPRLAVLVSCQSAGTGGDASPETEARWRPWGQNLRYSSL